MCYSLKVPYSIWRGHITLLNRKVMEDRVSEGYAVLKKGYRPLAAE